MNIFDELSKTNLHDIDPSSEVTNVDDIVNPTSENAPIESLDARLSRERDEWGETVKSMSASFKKVTSLGELMVTIYTDRQRCVEYYHYLLSILVKINIRYRKEYAARYDYWTTKSQIRYPNESTKTNKIMSEMSKIHEQRESIENHANFMKNTLATIDNIIYAIPRRIDIEHISKGDR